MASGAPVTSALHPVIHRRAELGIDSTRVLAETAGVAHSTVERLEAGITLVPHPQPLTRIAAALELDPVDLEIRLLRHRIVVLKGRA